jgi:small subunit ribosomal protein S2e
LNRKFRFASSGNPLKAKLSTSIIELQTALDTTAKAYIASHLPNYQHHPTWLTHLAVVQPPEEAVLVIVDAATEAEVTDGDGEAHAAAATSQRRKNGSQSPSSVVSSRQGRSRAWNRSTSTRYQSKNTRLSTFSCQNWRMKWWRWAHTTVTETGGQLQASLFLGVWRIFYQTTPDLTNLKTQIKPVQKQTRAGQRTRFKAIVVIGDSEGHVGLGIKTSKEVATAIRAAIIIAKLSVLPIRRGYWGTNLGEPHSLPTKESGKCGSVTVRLIPAPRGTGLVASPAVKRLLQLAGVQDAYTSSAGSTKTLENTLKATFVAVGNSYGFLTPNLWKETKLIRSPLEEYGDVLREGKRY